MAGSLLVLFGVVGGFVPVLQGWVFVLAGRAVMAPESRRARTWLERLKAIRARNKAGAGTGGKR